MEGRDTRPGASEFQQRIPPEKIQGLEKLQQRNSGREKIPDKIPGLEKLQQRNERNAGHEKLQQKIPGLEKLQLQGLDKLKKRIPPRPDKEEGKISNFKDKEPQDGCKEKIPGLGTDQDGKETRIPGIGSDTDESSPGPSSSKFSFSRLIRNHLLICIGGTDMVEA